MTPVPTDPLAAPPMPNPLSQEQREDAAARLAQIAAEVALWNEDDLDEDDLKQAPREEWAHRFAAISAAIGRAGERITGDDIAWDTLTEALRALQAAEPDHLLNAILAKLSETLEASTPARFELLRNAQSARQQEQGFVLRPVLGQPEPLPYPPFVYTIGLSAKGLPDLVIVGVELTIASAFMQRAAEAVVSRGLRFTAGERVTVDGVPLLVVDAPDSVSQEMRAARAVAYEQGLDFAALQLIWADAKGLLPGDPDAAQASFDMQVYPTY